MAADKKPATKGGSKTHSDSSKAKTAKQPANSPKETIKPRRISEGKEYK
jgi:hypothetical protein